MTWQDIDLDTGGDEPWHNLYPAELLTTEALVRETFRRPAWWD